MDIKKTFKNFDFQSNSINDEERSIIITASTKQVDRYGDTIQPTAFQLEKIQSLPILFNHNPDAPVGKTMWAKITDQGLLLKVYVSNKTQLAKDTWELIKEGIINFASVGFVPEEYDQTETGYNFTKVDLLETSFTPTPANPGAIALMMKSIQSPEIKSLFEKSLFENKISELEKTIDILKIESDSIKKDNEEILVKILDLETIKSTIEKITNDNENIKKELEIIKSKFQTKKVEIDIEKMILDRLNEKLGK